MLQIFRMMVPLDSFLTTNEELAHQIGLKLMQKFKLLMPRSLQVNQTMAFLRTEKRHVGKENSNKHV